MATWHQHQAMRRFREANPGKVYPLYEPHDTKWKCVSGSGGQFASAMLFDKEGDAVAYSRKTGDMVIGPKNEQAELQEKGAQAQA